MRKTCYSVIVALFIFEAAALLYSRVPLSAHGDFANSIAMAAIVLGVVAGLVQWLAAQWIYLLDLSDGRGDIGDH